MTHLPGIGPSSTSAPAPLDGLAPHPCHDVSEPPAETLTAQPPQPSSLARAFYGGFIEQPGALGPSTASPQLSPVDVKLRAHVDEARLREHVYTLAGPTMAGRDNNSVESARARAYLVKELAALGLTPLFGASFEQPIMLANGDRHGTNLGAVLPATEPNPKGEYVMLVAHYDHLGVEGGKVIAGADDNASGVAAVLEAVRALVRSAPKRRHDIVVVFPDCEEPPDVRTERMGSRYLMDHLPRAKDALRLAIVADVIGGDSLPGELLVLGAETSPAASKLTARVKDEAGAHVSRVSVAQVEKFLLPWERRGKSDYDSVRRHGRPSLFLTTGTTPHYHAPSDTPDTVSYSKLKAVTRYLAGLTLAAANDTAAVTYDEHVVDPQADLESLERLIRLVLANRPPDLLPARQAKLERGLTRIAEMKATLRTRGALGPATYYELMGIALEMQIALTRPALTTWQILWHELKTRLAHIFGGK